MLRGTLTAISLDLLRLGYTVRFAATGRSMDPAIREGEMIHVEPVDCAALAVDDIILFGTTRGLTAHRVVEVIAPIETRASQRLFLSRGDSFSAWFEPVAAEQILGLVIAVERDGRRLDLTTLPHRSQPDLGRAALQLHRRWVPCFIRDALGLLSTLGALARTLATGRAADPPHRRPRD